MRVFNVHEAKTHLSRLLEQVAQGEDVVIARSGKPVARLVRIATEPRRPGSLKGRLRLDGLDEPLPAEILAAFRGETE